MKHKISTWVLLIISAFVFIACAKNAPKAQNLDLHEQINSGKSSIPFATTKAESNKWYKEHFSPTIKDSKLSKEDIKAFEDFAKIYFADLSMLEPNHKYVKPSMLLQSVSFTLFSKEMLKEYIFIESLENIEIAPWQLFSSKVDLKDSIMGAVFVLSISDEIEQLQAKSYENLNNIVLADNLMRLNNKYKNKAQTTSTAQNITGIKEYALPSNLKSLLSYRILYAKYDEKLSSALLLNKYAMNYPAKMRLASNKIFGTSFNKNDIKSMQKQFNLPPFDRGNPIVLMQCKAGFSSYPYANACKKEVFLGWIPYLQNVLKTETKTLDSNIDFAFPIFTDSKLCIIVLKDRVISYPHNDGEFCKRLINDL